MEEKAASSSSSETEFAERSAKSSNWKINLSSFSKCKTKLITAINDYSACGELMRAYFRNGGNTFQNLPWKEKRPMHGIFPLHKFFYIECNVNEKGAMDSIAGLKHVQYTDDGLSFSTEMQKQNSEYVEKNRYEWGEEEGTCMPTYDQMIFFPRQAFDAFQDYCEAHSIHSDDNRTKKVNAISKTDYKKLVRSCKRWLKANHRMWSVIVSHLQSTSMHVTSGMEISNDIVLLSTLKTKFGNTHAQCLAAMLRILTNVTMHTKDPNPRQSSTTWIGFNESQEMLLRFPQ